jgi:diadenosine tetraphosphate (Ap4A) HIT family hydrolase
MDPCLFCEEIETRPAVFAVLEETDLTLTFLTPAQWEVGQCVVIPRRHASTLLDLTDDESLAVIAAARRIMQALIDSLQPLGVLLYQNNGVWSGQEVPHFHLHVVPRQPGSDWGVGPPQVARLEAGLKPAGRRATNEALMATAERLRPYLGATPGNS